MNAPCTYPNWHAAPLADYANWLTSVGGNANNLWAERIVRVDYDGSLHGINGCHIAASHKSVWDPSSGNTNNVCQQCLLTVNTAGVAVPRCSNRHLGSLARLEAYLDNSVELRDISDDQLRWVLHAAASDELDVPKVHDELHREATRRIAEEADTHIGAELAQRDRQIAGALHTVLPWTSPNVCLIDVRRLGHNIPCGPQHPALLYGPWSVVTEHGDVLCAVVPASVAFASDAQFRQQILNDGGTSSSRVVTVDVADLNDTVLQVIAGLLHDGVNLNDAYLTATALHHAAS
jgi:hypothetical protein